ncbi:MAG: cupin domain-containing protein [Phycisphaerales bacterium]|nr:cupin domain-containing protein [Phycisphaerales bacterium]
MLLRRIEEMPAVPVSMPGAEAVGMRLLLGRSDGAPTFAMRHFTVSPGGHTPRHQHNYEHGVYVVAGAGTVEVAGQSRAIRSGDSLFIEPNTEHQFRADAGESLQFLCMVPTTFDCGKPTPGS